MADVAIAPNGRHVRSLFLSDVHLGYQCAQAEKILQLLLRVRPEQIYLVGDFIDGWRLRRHWHWQPVYIKLLQRLLQLEATGTELFYTPGNHDEFFRTLLADHDGALGLVQISEEFRYQTVHGEKWLVLHGDQFDHDLEQRSWLKAIGGTAYDLLVAVDHHWNGALRRMDLAEYRFSSSVKHRIPRAVRFMAAFEQRLVAYARSRDCTGVICGHIHAPRLHSHGSVVYANTGDWVENCTALIESSRGDWQLLSFADPATPKILSSHSPGQPLGGVSDLTVWCFTEDGSLPSSDTETHSVAADFAV